MKTFFSYNSGDNIVEVSNLLISNNIEIIDSIKDMQLGSSFHQSIKHELNKCDFVTLIYSAMNPNIAFVAGIAVALNKPIFTIFAGGVEDTFLLDSTYVHAHASESEKIKFSFELFLKSLSVKKRKRKTYTLPVHKFYGGGKAKPIKNDFNIIERYNSIKDKSGFELEVFFQDLFIAYNVNLVKNRSVKEDKKWSPEFSIWSDELSLVLDNPIIIEIKSEINHFNLKVLTSNLNNLHSTNSIVGSCLVLYDQLHNIKQEDLPSTPRQLFISIPQLVSELQHQGFASSIIKIRNNLVHNI